MSDEVAEATASQLQRGARRHATAVTAKKPARATFRFVLALLFVVGASASGQEGPVTFEFSFSNPGARSLALAGAFTALADDATAAFANPAGLVQLIDPEVSFEGRLWSYETPFVSGGRASGLPTGEGIDTTADLRSGISRTDATNLSFASFVYPRKRWSIAIYRHTWADFELRSEVNGLFGTLEEAERSEDIRASTRVEVVNSGLALAFEVTETFSIGMAAVHFDAVVDSTSIEYGIGDSDFFESNPFTPDLVDTVYSYDSDSTGILPHVGLLWRPTPSWSLGAFFREGPRLTLDVLEVVGPANDDAPEGTIDLQASTPLRLPDVYGVGLAYRKPNGALTVSFEWARVGYSSITRDLDTTVFDPDQLVLEDGDELHLGFEYVLLRTSPIVALRAGVWRDPAHSVGSGPEADLFERAIFQSGRDETHVSGGFGLVFPRFQIDLGVDTSDDAEVLSLSFVYRF